MSSSSSSSSLIPARFRSISLFTLFSITPTSTPSQITSAYRRIALKYHPDHNHSPTANDEFSYISKCHQILSNAEKRKILAKYDGNLEKMEKDEGGSAVDSFGNGDDEGSLAYWRSVFPKISVEDIEKYKENYVGSEEELDDIKKCFEDFGASNLTTYYECIPFVDSTSFPRIISLLNQHFKCKITQKQIDKAVKEVQEMEEEEESEAEEALNALKLLPERERKMLMGNDDHDDYDNNNSDNDENEEEEVVVKSKGKAKGKEKTVKVKAPTKGKGNVKGHSSSSTIGSEQSLAAIIASRQKERFSQFDKLEQKYSLLQRQEEEEEEKKKNGKGKGKGKGKDVPSSSSTYEMSDEDFLKIQNQMDKKRQNENKKSEKKTENVNENSKGKGKGNGKRKAQEENDNDLNATEDEDEAMENAEAPPSKSQKVTKGKGKGAVAKHSSSSSPTKKSKGK